VIKVIKVIVGRICGTRGSDPPEENGADLMKKAGMNEAGAPRDKSGVIQANPGSSWFISWGSVVGKLDSAQPGSGAGVWFLRFVEVGRNVAAFRSY